MAEYVTKGRSANEIGAELGKDPTTVWHWLHEYSIPTRPRGSNVGPQFKKGEPSRFAGYSHTPENRERHRRLMLERGSVPYLKDGTHWLKGKRGAETPAWKGGSTPERQALYSRLEWRTVAAAVRARDKGICQRCGAGPDCSTDIHHLAPFEVEALRCEAANLVLLCEPCHAFVHSPRNTSKECVREGA